MAIVYGLPRWEYRRTISRDDIEHARWNNQFCLKGIDPKFPDDAKQPNIVVFLEQVYCTGTFAVWDVEGNVLFSSMTTGFTALKTPLRIDGGFKLIGNILMAKGFYIE